MENKDERLYTEQEVLDIAAKMSANTKAKDLSSQLTEKGIEDKEGVISYLSSYATDKRKELLNSEFGKGKSKASQKLEKAISKHFPELDFDDMQQEEMLEHIAKNLNALKDKSDNISYEKAMAVKEVADSFKKIKEKAALAEQYQNDLETFKKGTQFLEHVLPIMEDMGAQFSKNPERRSKQLQDLRNSAANEHFEFRNNKIVFLDGEGNLKMNQDKGEVYETNDYLKKISPVDFVKQEQSNNNNNNRNPYIPSTKTKENNNFGYSQEQLKGVTAKDVQDARNEKNPEKVAFLKETMRENLSSKEN